MLANSTGISELISYYKILGFKGQHRARAKQFVVNSREDQGLLGSLVGVGFLFVVFYFAFWGKAVYENKVAEESSANK